MKRAIAATIAWIVGFTVYHWTQASHRAHDAYLVAMKHCYDVVLPVGHPCLDQAHIAMSREQDDQLQLGFWIACWSAAVVWTLVWLWRRWRRQSGRG